MSIDRMKQYGSLVQTFSARVVLLHEAAAALLGLHATDLKVLGLLGDKIMTAGELVGLTGLTGASVTALVDRLEAAGYVTRFRDTQDRRKVGIRTIAARMRKLDRLYGKLNSAMTDVIEKLYRCGIFHRDRLFDENDCRCDQRDHNFAIRREETAQEIPAGA